MVSWKLIAAGWLAGVLCAQAPSDLFEQAPPPVDEALRARVAKFYQAHVDGKFRLADQYVAEESKDDFFAMDKPRYRAFEIIKITYSDQFRKARVLTTCDSEMFAGASKIPVKVPIVSLWKLIGGEWFWYLEPRPEVIETPFGKMTSAKPQAGSAPPAKPIPDVASILKQVKVEPTEVRLSSYEPAAGEVTVSNQMPGNISVSLSYNGFPGFKASLSRDKLGPGETAKILLECKPADRAPKPTLVLRVQIEPTGQVVPVRVTFSVPPEIEKKIPK